MSEQATPSLQVGADVPEFKLNTFEPTKKGFGEFSLAEAKKNKQWTILFFYPADFTFV
jgi:NADH-dependent peroxiredoxin subunit C